MQCSEGLTRYSKCSIYLDYLVLGGILHVSLTAEEKEAPQEAWERVVLTREGSQEILPQEKAQQETQQEAQETREEEKERRGGLILVDTLCLHIIDNTV